MTQQEFNKAIITISKDKLASLPIAGYPGKIVMIDNQKKLEQAVKNLNSMPVIGFDTETRPSFRRGQSYKVALIQLATPECCYLFRTNEIGYPKELIEILENPGITKVGLSVHDDFLHLRRVTEIEPHGFIDLQSYVKEFKIADNSLSRLYGILFGERISKGQRLTNWEQAELTESQQAYAALDAYACIRIYEFLKEGKFNPRESKYLTLPPEPKENQDKEIK
ncbi:MAG: 3'-5' exonuclease domain-containing protein 2 [Muribaculaceae bacterium]|nr:3'-5' exonuclease domain-containing protein 2 [Muribaculaceae bacterium]